jgi:hypothetical protein
MTAPTKAMQSVGATFSFAPSQPATNDAAGFAAVTGWLEVGELDNIPEYGPETATVSRTPLKTGVTDKEKGSTDYGSFTLDGGWAPGDVGQAGLIAASAPTAAAGSCKVRFPDGTIDYFVGLVMSYKRTVGASGDFVKFTSKVEIKNAIVNVPAP